MSANPLPTSLVGDAVVAYLGWGTVRTPQRDKGAVAELAPDGREDELLDAVLRVIAASDQIVISATNLADPTAAPECKSKLEAIFPGLSHAAIDALVSRWFFNAFW